MKNDHIICGEEQAFVCRFVFLFSGFLLPPASYIVTKSTATICYPLTSVSRSFVFLSFVVPPRLLNDDRYGDGRKLPLAIMVSDDTVERTRDMLEKGDWFGLEKDQVTIMKQEKVAAIQVGTNLVTTRTMYFVATIRE